MPSTSLFSLWSFYARYRQDRWKICYYVTVWREKRDSLTRGHPFTYDLECLYLRLPREAPRVSRRVSLDFLPEDVQTGPYWFDGSIYRLSRSAHELALETSLATHRITHGLQLQQTRQSRLLYYEGAIERALHRANLQIDGLAEKLLHAENAIDRKSNSSSCINRTRGSHVSAVHCIDAKIISSTRILFESSIVESKITNILGNNSVARRKYSWEPFVIIISRRYVH